MPDRTNNADLESGGPEREGGSPEQEAGSSERETGSPERESGGSEQEAGRSDHDAFRTDPGVARWPYRQYADGRFLDAEAVVAAEFPLTLRVNGEEFATIVCTPERLDDLVVGFLASEGVIRSAGEIASLTVSPDTGFAVVELAGKAVPGREFYAKRMIGSCCGKSREFYFVNDARTAKTIRSRHRVPAERCLAWMAELERHSDAFRRTGGVHNAALFGPDGLAAVRSDIGRHNALDKLYGHVLRERVRVADKTIAFSGRLSSEVVLKAAKIGVGLLLSKSAPTDLALRLADELGLTAVGFIRGGRMNVYTHPERVSET